MTDGRNPHCVQNEDVAERRFVVDRPEWKAALFAAPGTHGSVLAMAGLVLILFPKLALGLSGFETGVAVMPLVKGDPGDTPENPAGD